MAESENVRAQGFNIRSTGFVGEAIYEESPSFLTPQQVAQEVDAELGTPFDRTEALYCGFVDDPEAQATHGRVGYNLPKESVVWDFDPGDNFNPFLLR